MNKYSDVRAINDIRLLALDMIHEAGSGHPGIALDAAPILYTLFKNHMDFDLERKDWINRVLRSLNLIDNPISFMYNNLGVFIGLVYTLLPFMILPVYSSVSKIDKKVLEAAEDLGANSYQKFMKVILPQTLPGIFNGSLMVFIPAIGMFFIADLLGGGKIMLIGNLIKNQFLVSRNWPFGAAISIFLIVITFILVKFYKKSGGNMDDLGGF